MGITYPTFSELRQEARAELIRRQPGVDPTVQTHWAAMFLEGISANALTTIETIKDLEEQAFPQTADGEFLERWAYYENLTRLAATSSTGTIVASGTTGTAVPSGATWRSAAGVTVESTSGVTVATEARSVTTITRVGTTATATTSVAHGYATGLSVTISGAVQTEYNGAKDIVVNGEDTFTFTVEGSPATPATGTITTTADIATIPVQSQDTGQDQNIAGGATLSLSSAVISGLSTSAGVVYAGITDGADIESDAALRTRVILSRSAIDGVFTEDQVKLAAYGVNGNTRVYVVRPTLITTPVSLSPGDQPGPGQVVVYFLRDNDVSIIPNTTQIAQTKQAIIDNGKLPAIMSESDLYVFAPVPTTVNFTFSAISPDTATMRTAIELQLQAFFQDSVEFEQTITEAAYIGAINATQDLETGSFLDSFTLSTPTGDITPASGGIAILGTVSYV